MKLAVLVLALAFAPSACTVRLWRAPLGPHESRVPMRIERERVALHVSGAGDDAVLDLGIGPRDQAGGLRHLHLVDCSDGGLTARLLDEAAGLEATALTVRFGERDPRALAPSTLVLALSGRLPVDRGGTAGGPLPASDLARLAALSPALGDPLDHEGTTRRVLDFVHESRWSATFLPGPVPAPSVSVRVRIEASVRRAVGTPLVLDLGMRLLLTPFCLTLDLATLGLLSLLQDEDGELGDLHAELVGLDGRG
ncbi:MAG: hypothetical protein IT457_02630 [Planctomycetes bacterium]|nr:hypothetical protein [Planctomycetota bacterium]